MKIEHFIEIAATEGRVTTTYRFYGQGTWKVKDGDGWNSINAIYIPGPVLKVAAVYCEPPEALRHPSFLSERDIARLCGGR